MSPTKNDAAPLAGRAGVNGPNVRQNPTTPRSTVWRAALAQVLRRRGWLTLVGEAGDAMIDAALRRAGKRGAR